LTLTAPFLLCDFQQRRALPDARIVHQDVDPALAFHYVLNKCNNRTPARHVARSSHYLEAFTGHLCNHRFHADLDGDGMAVSGVSGLLAVILRPGSL